MFVDTSHGKLSYQEYGEGNAAVLFIHGNSSCQKFFKRQMTGEFYERYRMITFDLPGHGESEDSPQSHEVTPCQNLRPENLWDPPSGCEPNRRYEG